MLSHASAKMLSRTILQGTSRRIVGLSTTAAMTTTRTTSRIASARVIVPKNHQGGGGGATTTRRWMTEQAAKETTASAEKAAVEMEKKTSWWSDAKFWGGLGALAGWGMSASAIYDAFMQGPEVISLTMTPVLIVYSTLFARWAYVVTPPNPLLMWCHVANVAAQVNQFRRALQYKMENGQEEEVKDIVTKIGAGAAATALAVVAGPTARKALVGAGLGVISTIAAGKSFFRYYFSFVSDFFFWICASKIIIIVLAQPMRVPLRFISGLPCRNGLLVEPPLWNCTARPIKFPCPNIPPSP